MSNNLSAVGGEAFCDTDNNKWTYKKSKTLFALYKITMSYTLSTVGGVAVYDTDNNLSNHVGLYLGKKTHI